MYVYGDDDADDDDCNGSYAAGYDESHAYGELISDYESGHVDEYCEVVVAMATTMARMCTMPRMIGVAVEWPHKTVPMLIGTLMMTLGKVAM